MDEHSAKAGPFGVGIIGAGLVTRSIHLPALAALPGLFSVRALWDVDAGVTAILAETCGARAASDLDDLLAEPGLDVVAVCSPARFHAEHAIAALRAGAKVVLIEKPLCASAEEADAIAAAAAETGGAVVVGAMHLYDAAWQFMAAQVSAMDGDATLIRSSIILPPNRRFDGWASEAVVPPPSAAPPQRTLAEMMRMSVLELAIHNLPLVRRLLVPGAVPEVLLARRFRPFGYMVSIKAGEQLVDLFAFLHAHWRPEWTLTATAPNWQARAEFTPSFVMAGSGTASVTDAAGTRAMCPTDENGYVGEWREIAAILSGSAPQPDRQAFVADFQFALAIAEQAVALINAGDAQ